MNIQRVRAMVLQDFYIIRQDILARSDIVFFSFLNLFVLGGIGVHLSGGTSSIEGESLLVGLLMWEVVRPCQYLLTSLSLWNLYSRNLSNLFIAPLSVGEFVAGSVLSAVYKTLILFVPLCVVARVVFDFNVFSIGVGLLAIAIVTLLLFASAIGLVLTGVVFQFGLRVQALSWAAVFLFQPLIGVYFPVDVLPRVLQVVAHGLPATHTFDAIHNALDGTGSVLRPALVGFVLVIVMFTASIKVFDISCQRSRVSGQFARNNS